VQRRSAPLGEQFQPDRHAVFGRRIRDRGKMLGDGLDRAGGPVRVARGAGSDGDDRRREPGQPVHAGTDQLRAFPRILRGAGPVEGNAEDRMNPRHAERGGDAMFSHEIRDLLIIAVAEFPFPQADGRSADRNGLLDVVVHAVVGSGV
jgi:hypothetical protein